MHGNARYNNLAQKAERYYKEEPRTQNVPKIFMKRQKVQRRSGRYFLIKEKLLYQGVIRQLPEGPRERHLSHLSPVQKAIIHLK